MSRVDRKPAPGERVVLEELPPGLLQGLPAEDQKAIPEILGKPVRLNEYDNEGRAELEFIDSEGQVHFIYVSSELIRVV